MKPTFFKTPAALRRWFERHGGSEDELWIAMYKKASGKAGITYKEALDEALCFGWIDGVRKRLDDEAFVQRFSPRESKSYWSVVNTKRANELIADGRMDASGRAAFERRDARADARYSFERAHATLNAAETARFRANAAAWRYFEAQAPSYRRAITHWVTSAKRPETRARRLDTLIRECAAGRRIGP